MTTVISPFNRSGFRMWLMRSRAWLSILILLPVAVLAALSRPPLATGSWAALACDSLGWLTFLSGAIVRWWATLYIGGRKYASLATEGPYSVCRNPLYVGTFFLGVSVACYEQSLLFGAIFLGVSVFYLAITVPVEEAMLRERFGDRFADYCRSVPRFVPRFKGYRSPPTIESSVVGLKAELRRAARWLWIPVLCLLFRHLRMESWWPVIALLP